MKIRFALFFFLSFFTSFCCASSSSEPDLIFERPLIQGGLVFGRTEAQLLMINKRELEIDDEGRFVFGLGRKAGAVLDVKMFKSDGEKFTRSFPVTQREYAVQRIEGIEKKYVTPPPEVSERIAREVQQVKRIRNTKRDSYEYLGKAIWPTKGIVTGVYGSERFYNGVPRSPHYGIDIAGPTGQAVVAPLAGKVTFVGDLYFSGGTLILDHGRGVSSTFIHLSEFHAKVGDEVEQGDLIADVGATGRVTGPHLDWRMNWFNKRLDPELLLPPKD